MKKKIELCLIGCASGLAGADTNSGNGPLVIQNSSFWQALKNDEMQVRWEVMLTPKLSISLDDALKDLYQQLAKKVSNMVKQEMRACVVGGDHSCAIGTWSGVYDAVHQKGDIGLIWVDAHMDSHTPETSESGRIHGMPLACLLGYGFTSLTNILHTAPKIKPENLCLIGVRSFEPGEAEFLKRLNVRIYDMEEVRQRGFEVVMNEAMQVVSEKTIGYGLSIDLDGIDPKEAPGVDVPEPNGIHVHDLIAGVRQLANDPRLLLTEIVEFDPQRDIDRKTEKIFVDLLKTLAMNE